jgi:hypothetical protein
VPPSDFSPGTVADAGLHFHAATLTAFLVEARAVAMGQAEKNMYVVAPQDSGPLAVGDFVFVKSFRRWTGDEEQKGGGAQVEGTGGVQYGFIKVRWLLQFGTDDVPIADDDSRVSRLVARDAHIFGDQMAPGVPVWFRSLLRVLVHLCIVQLDCACLRAIHAFCEADGTGLDGSVVLSAPYEVGLRGDDDAVADHRSLWWGCPEEVRLCVSRMLPAGSIRLDHPDQFEYAAEWRSLTAPLRVYYSSTINGGGTATTLAAAAGSADGMRTLHDLGVDLLTNGVVGGRGGHDWTAAHFACLGCHPACLHALHDCGAGGLLARSNKTEGRGAPPINSCMSASAHTDTTGCIRTLGELGAFDQSTWSKPGHGPAFVAILHADMYNMPGVVALRLRALHEAGGTTALMQPMSEGQRSTLGSPRECDSVVEFTPAHETQHVEILQALHECLAEYLDPQIDQMRVQAGYMDGRRVNGQQVSCGPYLKLMEQARNLAVPQRTRNTAAGEDPDLSFQRVPAAALARGWCRSEWRSKEDMETVQSTEMDEPNMMRDAVQASFYIPLGKDDDEKRRNAEREMTRLRYFARIGGLAPLWANIKPADLDSWPVCSKPGCMHRACGPDRFEKTPVSVLYGEDFHEMEDTCSVCGAKHTCSDQTCVWLKLRAPFKQDIRLRAMDVDRTAMAHNPECLQEHKNFFQKLTVRALSVDYASVQDMYGLISGLLAVAKYFDFEYYMHGDFDTLPMPDFASQLLAKLESTQPVAGLCTYHGIVQRASECATMSDFFGPRWEGLFRSARVRSFVEQSVLTVYPAEGKRRVWITQADYDVLAPFEFLNDTVIDFWCARATHGPRVLYVAPLSAAHSPPRHTCTYCVRVGS